MDRQLKKGAILKNRYKIHMQLGAGGFGTVYRCLDQESRKWRALKIMSRQSYNNESYIGERKTLEELQGLDGTPVLFDAFDIGKLEVLVMQLYVGDLCSLRQKPFAPKLTCKVALELVKIVRSVHEAGFIHRDIKAANVMVPFDQKKSRLVLVDFGMTIRFSKKRRANTNSMRRIPVPCNDFDFGQCPYAARRCVEGQPAQETEDLEQVGLLLMELREIFPFGGTKEELLEQKTAFATDPQQFLTLSNLFLWPILHVILAQEYCEKPNYAKILKTIRMNGYVLSEFGPIPIKTSKTGHPYIE
ncbi:unnamed protein product [Caenorhabditis brenneri]